MKFYFTKNSITLSKQEIEM